MGPASLPINEALKHLPQKSYDTITTSTLDIVGTFEDIKLSNTEAHDLRRRTSLHIAVLCCRRTFGDLCHQQHG